MTLTYFTARSFVETGFYMGKSENYGLFENYCRDFTEKKSPQCRGFLQGFYRKEVPAVQGLYLGFANGKVNIPAISRPRGGRDCK